MSQPARDAPHDNDSAPADSTDASTDVGRNLDAHTAPAERGERGGPWKDGSTGQLSARSLAVAATTAASERLQQRIASLELEDIHVEGLVERMKHKQRWAHQLYAKYRLAAGDTAPLVEKIRRALGGASVEIARLALDAHRAGAAAAADPRVLLEQAESYLARRYAEAPALAYRSPLRRLLLDMDAGKVQVLEHGEVRAHGLADAESRDAEATQGGSPMGVGEK